MQSGQRAVLPEALNLALKQTGDPASASPADLSMAVRMLLQYGDEQQFAALEATMRRLQQQDENRYREMWGAAASGKNRRELRLAAILIGDRRPGFGSLRYCDAAAGVVQMVSGEKFGPVRFEQIPLTTRTATWRRRLPG